MKLDLRSRTRRRVDELERLLRNEQRAGAQAAARIANLEREMSQTWELLAVFDDRGGEMKDTRKFLEAIADRATRRTVGLRMWTGKPYRSKQRVLLETKLDRIEVIRIDEKGIIVQAHTRAGAGNSSKATDTQNETQP